MSHPVNKNETPADKNSGRIPTKNKKKMDIAKANRILIIAAIVCAIGLCVSIFFKVSEDAKAEASAHTLLERYKEKQAEGFTGEAKTEQAQGEVQQGANILADPTVTPEPTQAPDEAAENASVYSEGSSNRHDASHDIAVDETADYVQPDAPEEENMDAMIDQIVNSIGEDGVVGIISIPKTGQEYPIIGKWSYKLLKISICKYKGPKLNEKGNVVLIGHNYKSGAHFGRLDELVVGDEVFITAAGSDVPVRYEVYNIVDIDDDNFSALNKTKGEYTLTLMTCTTSSHKRKLVRCVKKAATADADILTDMRNQNNKY